MIAFEERRAFVGGRPVTIVGEWDEYPDCGWCYRYDGDRVTHWIRCGNPFLTGTLPKASYSVPAPLDLVAPGKSASSVADLC